MYVGTDDARSDVILAGAATIFGGFLIRLVTQLPLYPRTGWVALLLGVVWIFALTGLVPLLLSRYRGDGRAAFGLTGDRSGWVAGLPLLVAPALAAALLTWLRTGDPAGAALGRLGGLRGAAALGGVGLPPGAAVVTALQFLALTVGALLLVGFLTVRGHEAFRAVDVPLTQLVRTLGMGAAGVALVFGLARSIGAAPRLVPAVVNAVALAALVLLADRLVPAGRTIPRAAVVTPLVVVVVAHVFATGGFIFGDLVTGLYTGGLAAGTTVVIAALVSIPGRAWAAVPLVVGLHWWPTCLSPLALEVGVALC